MKSIEKKNGFTVIEIVLVLAIAGLIFLMVFIVLPSLQRQARDTQRRRDMETVISAIKKYQSNNRGALPSGNSSDWRNKLRPYLPKEFESPSGKEYSIDVRDCGYGVGHNCSTSTYDSVGFNDSKVYIVKAAKCEGSTVVGSSNSRMVVVAFKLEGGGSFCGNT